MGSKAIGDEWRPPYRWFGESHNSAVYLKHGGEMVRPARGIISILFLYDYPFTQGSVKDFPLRGK